MIILGLDTSHNKCSVAISDGDKILAALTSLKQSSQAEDLLIMVEEVLNQANFSYDDIDYLGVTKGPGSFTGIRIGLAAARGIVMASKIRPIVVSSFEAINFRTQMAVKNFDYSVAIINAYRAQIYAQTFDSRGVAIAEPALLGLNETVDYIKCLKGVVAIGGSGLGQLEILHDVISLPRFPHPEAKSVCRLANMQLTLDNYSSDLSPLYIRPPDAKLPSVNFGS